MGSPSVVPSRRSILRRRVPGPIACFGIVRSEKASPNRRKAAQDPLGARKRFQLRASVRYLRAQTNPAFDIAEYSLCVGQRTVTNVPGGADRGQFSRKRGTEMGVPRYSWVRFVPAEVPDVSRGHPRGVTDSGLCVRTPQAARFGPPFVPLGVWPRARGVPIVVLRPGSQKSSPRRLTHHETQFSCPANWSTTGSG